MKKHKKVRRINWRKIVCYTLIVMTLLALAWLVWQVQPASAQAIDVDQIECFGGWCPPHPPMRPVLYIPWVAQCLGPYCGCGGDQ